MKNPTPSVDAYLYLSRKIQPTFISIPFVIDGTLAFFWGASLQQPQEQQQKDEYRVATGDIADIYPHKTTS